MHLGLTTSIQSSQSQTSSPRSGNRSSDPVGSLRQRVKELVGERLWPAATEVDQGSLLPIANFEALIELGLYGMAIPTSAGGLGMSAPDVRATLQLLGSGCGVTAFAFAQHHGTAGMVLTTKNTELRDCWLPQLVSDRLAGIAYAHVRRRGTPILRAEPDGQGWVLSGTAPWVTSWGLAEVMGVAANTADGRIVWALLPAVESPGLAVGKTFDLLVYGATQTVALNFERLQVPAELVMSVADFATWAHRDRLLAARPNPLCLGIGDRALQQLGLVAPDVADALTPWWTDVVRRSEEQSAAVDRALRPPHSSEDTDSADSAVDGLQVDGLQVDGPQVDGPQVDDSPPHGADPADLRPSDRVLEAAAAARAESLMAVQRLCTAWLSATGGAAMETSHPAQRLSREALFYVIQAQSGDGRSAMLHQLQAATGQGPAT